MKPTKISLILSFGLLFGAQTVFAADNIYTASSFFDKATGAYFGPDCDQTNYSGAYYTGDYTSDNEHPNEIENCEKYGRLYTWASAMGKSEEECGNSHECGVTKFPHQGICPENWHLPTEAEWFILRDSIANHQSVNVDDVGIYLKTENDWINNGEESGGGNDFYGFSGLPAGYYDNSNFIKLGEIVTYWSSTEKSLHSSIYFELNYKYNDLNNDVHYKYYARSVRCIKN